ncbi:MAG: hypothetical protein Q4G50_10110 [Corynebacterium sp.]|uniref:hypothetical protein n=1 Tax=Corynebacterium sp. TaxID=1720 RepID=UPI0026DEC291|nr:hypothetical protein [Corynebacterium sp.]MDO5670348.1 hypothetical protein [Corynebacterium sp.]
MRRIIAGLAVLCLSTPAYAAPTPYDPEIAEQWVNPMARGAEDQDVAVDVLSVGESVVLSVGNSGADTARDLVLTTRRAEQTWDVASARRALALDAGAYPYAGPTVEVGDLGPGERREITVDLPEGFLPAGTTPVMFAVGDNTERLLLTTPVEGDPEAQIPGLTMLLPLSAEVDIIPGETGEAPQEAPLILASEQLAGQLTPGGRLSELLDIYATEQRGTCLAVDPALVDTVARMSRGYTVAPERPSLISSKQRLRDSWFSDDDPDPGQPGTGAADAAAWLEQLRAASCVVSLPWANADVNAVTRTEDEWLFREATQRGTEVLRSVLDVEPVPNVILPPSGYVTEQAVPSFGWADQSVPVDQAWEASVAARAPQPTGDSALESPIIPDRSGAPAPSQPVRVLVADNTVWGVPQAGVHANLAPGITARTFSAPLGSLLAATGPAPQTTGYSNPDWRLDYRLDSVTARAVTAASALRLAVAEQTLPGDWAQSPMPVFAAPAAHLDATTARQLLAAATSLIDARAARPIPLEEALSAPPLDAAGPGAIGVTRFGSPWTNPAAYADTEILRAAQQTRYTDDLTRMMVNDPVISLSRYGFTLPLRRDMLMALSATSRSSLATHEAAVAATNTRLDANRQTLQALRGSVALLPPGNVYTRASESSPLLVVAENGLPLPVDADLAYSGPAGARLDVQGSVHIPAHGSITVPITADLPDDDQTQLSLWLATRDGSPISTPVEITVQTRAGIVGTYGIALLVVVGLSLALLFRVGRHRRHQRP